MDRLSSLLPKVLHKRGIKDEADASMMVYAATELLKDHKTGDGIAVTKFTQGVLFLETASSVAAQEAHALSDELIEALKKKFPEKQIDGVRILREHSSLVR